MTPQQIEAMKLALDLATMHHTDNGYAALREKVRSASKEALAEHAMQEVQKLGQEIEQEPVACDGDFPEGFDASLGVPAQALRVANAIMCDVIGKREWDVPCTAQHVLSFAKKYTHPPQRKPLTDEDMYVVSEEESCSFIAGAKWSEEILKEKNAICSPFMISELWRLNK